MDVACFNHLYFFFWKLSFLGQVEADGEITWFWWKLMIYCTLSCSGGWRKKNMFTDSDATLLSWRRNSLRSNKTVEMRTCNGERTSDTQRSHWSNGLRRNKKLEIGNCTGEWVSTKNNQVSGLTHWEATNKWRLELALASELQTNNQASGSTDWEATTKWRLELALANSLQTNSQTSGAIDWQATTKQRLELGMPN